MLKHICYSVYVPAPDFGWYNLSSASQAYWDSHPLSETGDIGFSVYPAYLQGFPAINQSTYISADNPDILKLLGSGPIIERILVSEVWPPVDANGTAYSIVNNSAPVDPQAGLLAAIPVRYYFGSVNVEINGTTPDGAPYWTYNTSHRFTATPLYLPLANEDEIQQEMQNWVAWYSDTSYLPDRRLPFGGISVHDLDPTQAKIGMTMQFGVYDNSQSYSSDAPSGSGLRQIITMTQMTQAMARFKYGNNFTISQGIRALPYEFSWNRMNGEGLNKISMFMIPFALSFLLPTFVSILVQEKEDRHRMMMSMVKMAQDRYFLHLL